MFYKKEENMSKVAVVYWSGTGNTKIMADKVAEGAKDAGAEVSVFTPSQFGPDKINEFDAIALRLPFHGRRGSGGNGIRAYVTDCESKLGGKKIAPFRLLWMGRRRMDEKLGGKMRRPGNSAGL